jgi:hypothetical protein
MRVSVLNPDSSPAMPTKPSRARRWLKEGKAVVVHNDLNLFCVQLVAEPSGRETQDIVIGIDPGKLFTGIGVQTAKETLFKSHLALPFKAVTKKMASRRQLRRTRRGRRINRKVLFKLRDDDGWIDLGLFGYRLTQLSPDFDPRNYGYKQLKKLIKAVEIFEVRETPHENHPAHKVTEIKLKG